MSNTQNYLDAWRSLTSLNTLIAQRPLRAYVSLKAFCSLCALSALNSLSSLKCKTNINYMLPLILDCQLDPRVLVFRAVPAFLARLDRLGHPAYPEM